MLKRICKIVRISVSDGKDTIAQNYDDVNFNSMYDVMQKERLLESTFKMVYKRNIHTFIVQIIKE